MDLPGRFFFYGTLMAASGHPLARALHTRLHPLGPATVPGALFAIPDAAGWYPALLPGDGLVHGTLHAAGPDFAATDLAAIDGFEDFDSADPAASLYCR
ncbi:MAG TPA: gamma-glutamylcyclotransferase, partial [Novosphingobium sp.]|nr:gamma-glutamylcyclotransferase [Novosphingobium sp.]